MILDDIPALLDLAEGNEQYDCDQIEELDRRQSLIERLRMALDEAREALERDAAQSQQQAAEIARLREENERLRTREGT